MITRTLHSLAWRVISPSFYELAGYPVDVAFLGDAWYLQVPDDQGEPMMQPFKSLDEAAHFVSLAF